MNFSQGLFSHGWEYAAYAPLLLTVLWCVRTARWPRLLDRDQSNVWIGLIVVLATLWSMKAGVRPGLNLHLLGATAFTLMFGAQFAILGLLVVLAAVTALGGAAWGPFALNALVMAVFPVFFSWYFFRMVERKLPNQLFVYIFLNAFLGSALTILATGFAATLLLGAAGAYRLDYLLDNYLPYYFMLAFSEGMMGGMGVTIVVVYKPAWISTFDDRRYLANPNK